MSIALGKYAVAVLSAWGATLALLAVLVVQSLLASRRARHALEAEEALLRARRGSGNGAGRAHQALEANRDG